jgi:hypothetical protein
MFRRLLWVGLVALVAGACADPPRSGQFSSEPGDMGGAGDAGSAAVPSGDAGEGGADDGAAGAAGEPESGGAGSPSAGSGGRAEESGSGGAGGAQGGSAGRASGGTSGGGVGGAGRGGTGGTSGGSGGSAGSPAAGAGGACTCSSGACCDGCRPLPSTHLCASNQVHALTCVHAGLSGDIGKQFADLYCDGIETATCTRWVDTTYTATSCPNNQVCNAPTGVAPYCGSP